MNDKDICWVERCFVAARIIKFPLSRSKKAFDDEKKYARQYEEIIRALENGERINDRQFHMIDNAITVYEQNLSHSIDSCFVRLRLKRLRKALKRLKKAFWETLKR